MKHKLEVFSDGSVSLVTEAEGLGIAVSKDALGEPVISSDITIEDFERIAREDHSRLKFDVEKNELKSGKRKIMIKLEQKADNSNNDKSISNPASNNVSENTGPSAAQDA